MPSSRSGTRLEVTKRKQEGLETLENQTLRFSNTTLLTCGSNKSQGNSECIFNLTEIKVQDINYSV